MGYQIIKQPDGKLCVWSTFTDSVIITDATREELVDWFVDLDAERVRREANRILDHVEAGEPRKAYFQFTKTYDEAVKQSSEPLP